MGPMDSDTEYERLNALASYLEKFENAGFRFGQLHPPRTGKDGVISLPMFDFSAEASSFIQTCYDYGWISTELNWPEWMATDEARLLHDSPEFLSNASVEQIRRLLTVLIRQDRFVEGSLSGHYESGFLLRILMRVKDLAIEYRSRME